MRIPSSIRDERDPSGSYAKRPIWFAGGAADHYSDAAMSSPTRIRPLQIGNVSVPTNLVLSPMSGVTDCAFRSVVRACSGGHLGLVVSEFIAAEGLTRDNAKTLAMMRFKESERPVSIQIFGADVDRMVRAAVMVEQAGADVVDINCGCPAPKVVKRGGGAQLMREGSRLAEILAGIRRAVNIPFTVKIRSGWDADCLNADEIADIAVGEGAAMLAVHGRSRVQLYGGRADWDLVRGLSGRLPVPVLGSGDVSDPEIALERLDGAYASGLMVGRAAMGNPWIFAQIAARAADQPIPRPTRADRIGVLALFRDELRETLPDRAFIGRFRGLACRFTKGLAGGAAVRKRIGGLGTVEEVFDEFAAFISGFDELADPTEPYYQGRGAAARHRAQTRGSRVGSVVA